MSKLKYKVGDRVRIKSIDWYNRYTNGTKVNCKHYPFSCHMKKYCGQIMTISIVGGLSYSMIEDDGVYSWTDEMIEGLVEEETKPEPKFKVGDRIKWYNHTCNITSIDTNENIYTYLIKHNDYREDKTFAKWVPESELTFEDDEETKPKYEDEVNGEYYSTTKYLVRPNGYQFVDENGNVINAMKIVLEKVNTLKIQHDNMETETHRGYCTTDEETTNKSKKVAWFTFGDNDFADKVELDLSNRELIQEDGKWFVVKKKKEYPKTYEECCEVLSIPSYYKLKYSTYEHDYHEYTTSKKLCLLQDNLNTLGKLLICRDAYWKLCGDEMGLGKPWEPDYDSGVNKYGIICMNGVVQKSNPTTNWERHLNKVLDFPTAEMRDAFYEYFKEEIEKCKELL